MNKYIYLKFIFLIILVTFPANARNIRVGPNEILKKPSQAFKFAKDGDQIFIHAGRYLDDIAELTAHNVTVTGLNGTAHIQITKNITSKAVWVIKGDNIFIENITFSEARNSSHNAAGIHQVGNHLELYNVRSLHNQMGLSTSNNPTLKLIIRQSEFGFNSVDFKKYGSISHNLYIGNIAEVLLDNVKVYGASTGYNIKSSAKITTIIDSEIYDYFHFNEPNKTASSSLIDLPKAGQVTIQNSILRKSELSSSPFLINYGTAEKLHLENNLTLIDNQLYSQKEGSQIFNNPHKITPSMTGNDKKFISQKTGFLNWIKSLFD